MASDLTATTSRRLQQIAKDAGIPSTGNAAERASVSLITEHNARTWLRGVIAVVAAVVLALVVPYCKHSDCPALARSLPELATKALPECHIAMVQRLLDVACQAAVPRTATSCHCCLLQLSQRTGNQAAAQRHFDLAAVLHAIMGSKMQGAQAAAAAMLLSSRTNPPDKVTVMLFVCRTDADCCLLVKAVRQQLGTAKGALQHKVANHFKAVPDGIVVLSHLSQLLPVLLAVLINGMSEHGSFQQDGGTISTAGR
ncbi:hypothetical protein ACK3TF_003051 [Chlorella vulgaris]